MFTAAAHPLLVPFDGSFAPRQADTSPEKNDKTKDWKNLLEDEVTALGEQQQRLYADGRHAVLVIFQALDAAGKDGTIRNVFTGVDPCGLRVTSFKQPSRTDLAHDFLWRTTAGLPERGTIGVFNRSYYEEVLVARVHPEILAAQRLPADAAQSSSTSGTSQPRAPSSSSSGSTSRKTSSGSASSNESTIPTSTGSFTSATSTSAIAGTTTWRPIATH
jgi:hypothetical protein